MTWLKNRSSLTGWQSSLTGWQSRLKS